MRDFAHHASNYPPDVLLVGHVRIIVLDRLAIGVERITPRPQAHDGAVDLGHPLDAVDQPRGRANADDQNARRQRIESACMPDLHSGE